MFPGPWRRRQILSHRIALAAVFVSMLAVGIVAVGTLVLGGRSFVNLMTADGHSTASAQAMFDDSVGLAMALVGAIIAAAASVIPPCRSVNRRASAETDRRA